MKNLYLLLLSIIPFAILSIEQQETCIMNFVLEKSEGRSIGNGNNTPSKYFFVNHKLTNSSIFHHLFFLEKRRIFFPF
ncbi:hypothetical protein [Flammeovirga sp. OC4]|uniref:hypothetical protein n=1 Tax=Flammeovirga sp. OC4 TaxID=1382345 RepID=UPI0012E09F9A|nr:hypothetical protein [Flammeovirga sp. OC4]